MSTHQRWSTVLLGLVLLCSGALAQAPRPAFTLDIQAPAPLDSFLLRHIELARFQQLPDLQARELERLLATAPDNLRDLLGTQGHFAPRIEVRAAPPDPAVPEQPPRIHVTVDPGPLTRVTAVDLTLQGDAQDNPAAADQRAALLSGWSLPPGHVFTQATWDGAKNQALRQLSGLRYPAARVLDSRAEIDPATHSARLKLALDSGPVFRFGDIEVQGHERYDPAMAARLVRLGGVRSRADYDLSALQAAQQRLADSGYYESVFVRVDTEGTPDSATVHVQLREAQRQKLVLGIGGSTDSGPRLSIEHTHHRVPGLDWRAVSRLLLQQNTRTVESELVSPVDDKGWRWTVGGRLAQEEDDTRRTGSQRLRLGQAQADPELDRSFYLQYDRARVTDDLTGAGPAESALSVHYAWTRRRFDDRLAPGRGHGLAVEIGAGVTLQQDRRPYLRTHARWQGYLPLGVEGLRPSRLALRLEGGAVWSREGTPVPATQRFLTGGDNTVRGYGLRDIGATDASGATAPGRLLTVASLEWQRPLWRDGQRTNWESTLFIDAGSVADRASDLRPKVGLGAGVRYNSPVGPLQFDLAYGVDSRRWRLHLNVGFAF